MPPHPCAPVWAEEVYLLSLARCALLPVRVVGIMAVFCSTLTFMDEQVASSPDLEPAFENLLRALSVDEALNTALKVNMITDRETFVGLDDTEAGFRKIAPDLGIDLESGRLAHKREMLRLITAWKQARVTAEAKLQADPVAKVHRMPTTVLPED